MTPSTPAAAAARILSTSPRTYDLGTDLILPRRPGETPLHTVNRYIRRHTHLYLIRVNEAADCAWTRARPHWTPFMLAYSADPPNTTRTFRPLVACFIVAIRTGREPAPTT